MDEERSWVLQSHHVLDGKHFIHFLLHYIWSRTLPSHIFQSDDYCGLSCWLEKINTTYCFLGDIWSIHLCVQLSEGSFLLPEDPLWLLRWRGAFQRKRRRRLQIRQDRDLQWGDRCAQIHQSSIQLPTQGGQGGHRRRYRDARDGRTEDQSHHGQEPDNRGVGEVPAIVQGQQSHQ